MSSTKYLYYLNVSFIDTATMVLEREEKGLEKENLINSITPEEIEGCADDVTNTSLYDAIRNTLKYDRNDCEITEVEEEVI